MRSFIFRNYIFVASLVLLLSNCTQNKLDEKGIQVGVSSQPDSSTSSNGINNDSLKFETQPGSVLLTGIVSVRLTPVYKVNINKTSKSRFTGSNGFHYNYLDPENSYENNWHSNLMPGIEAVYGYNMINVSHYNIKENKQITFFEKPVLINTVYFPSATKDTLNSKPVSRDYFMVSVYNNDTNKDGFLNSKDLRHFYLFDKNGILQKALIPEDYSVFKSEYDPENDFMFVYAQLDENKNGRKDEDEPIHIFWIDLKNPSNTGRQY